jgi:predicted transcriptional regulator
MKTKSGGSGNVNWEQLARAEVPWLRISILEVLSIDGGRTLAPNELSYELQTPLTTVNHHTMTLVRAGILRLAHERQVRGTMEHFYCHSEHTAEDLFERL